LTPTLGLDPELQKFEPPTLQDGGNTMQKTAKL